MERMWSPWRAQHIEQMSDSAPTATPSDSVFSRLALDNQDEKNLILWRGRFVFVIMNLHPYNNGHLMIVPYRVVREYEALTREEQQELFETIPRCLAWLKAALKPEGFNVGMNLGTAGGAGIPDHIHLHIVPRWLGDTNFMPVVGEVKVIPEALAATYKKLRAVIEQQEPVAHQASPPAS